MLEIARARYPTDRWNIYAAQASDGDNYGADSGRCVALLGGEVLPLCQYVADLHIGEILAQRHHVPTHEGDAATAYRTVTLATPPCARRRVVVPQDHVS